MCGFWAILFHKLRREKGTADRQNSRIVGQVILGILKCTLREILYILEMFDIKILFSSHNYLLHYAPESFKM